MVNRVKNTWLTDINDLLKAFGNARDKARTHHY